MGNIIKYFVDPGNGKIFEIDASTSVEAAEKIKYDFRGSGGVRLIICEYKILTSTPFIIKT